MSRTCKHCLTKVEADQRPVSPWCNEGNTLPHDFQLDAPSPGMYYVYYSALDHPL